MKQELQQLKAKNDVLKTTTQKLVMKCSSDGGGGSKTKDIVLETVEPQYMGLAMKLVYKMSNGAIEEVSELSLDCKSPDQSGASEGIGVQALCCRA